MFLKNFGALKIHGGLTSEKQKVLYSIYKITECKYLYDIYPYSTYQSRHRY
jgi:hypothetical protein